MPPPVTCGPYQKSPNLEGQHRLGDLTPALGEKRADHTRKVVARAGAAPHPVTWEADKALPLDVVPEHREQPEQV